MKDIMNINIGERQKGGKNIMNKTKWYKSSLELQIESIDNIISIIKKDTKLYIESIYDDINGTDRASKLAINELERAKDRLYDIMDGVDKNEL